MHKLYEQGIIWRGSIAPELQWILYKGLVRYGYSELADQVKTDLLKLLIEKGNNISESFDNGHSTTAAAVINLIKA